MLGSSDGNALLEGTTLRTEMGVRSSLGENVGTRLGSSLGEELSSAVGRALGGKIATLVGFELGISLRRAFS